jgi:hypothetical protein
MLDILTPSTKKKLIIKIGNQIVKTTVRKLLRFSIHDTKTIEPSIEKLNITNVSKINVIGDKGYIVKDNVKKILYKKYKVKMIYPYHTNYHKKTSIKTKQLLKNRYVAEHTFLFLKKMKRIHIRLDRDINNYDGFPPGRYYLPLVNSI